MAHVVVKIKYKNVCWFLAVCGHKSEAKPVKLWEDLENYFK